VLLSSLPGAAVTAVKIEGVQHEFTSIPHVKEDVIDLLLNIKGLRLRALSDVPGRLFLESSGEGAVCAGDIKPSAEFEIVNPELHLATLDSADAQLSITFYVEQGKGYVPASRGDGLPLGVIPVDAIFTPVRRVNYAVGKTRVGQVSNYDKLTLEVWTDGTILPREALAQSAEILTKHFSLFSELGKVHIEGEEPLAPAIPPEKYEMPLEQLGLSARTFNSLRRSGITKVGELLEKNDDDLLALRSFGQKSLEEVQERLETLDLKPRAEEEDKKSGQGASDEKQAEEDTEEEKG
jgi:DNA-directed RNA polymerase subunit alpha